MANLALLVLYTFSAWSTGIVNIHPLVPLLDTMGND